VSEQRYNATAAYKGHEDYEKLRVIHTDLSEKKDNYYNESKYEKQYENVERDRDHMTSNPRQLNYRKRNSLLMGEKNHHKTSRRAFSVLISDIIRGTYRRKPLLKFYSSNRKNRNVKNRNINRNINNRNRNINNKNKRNKRNNPSSCNKEKVVSCEKTFKNNNNNNDACEKKRCVKPLLDCTKRSRECQNEAKRNRIENECFVRKPKSDCQRLKNDCNKPKNDCNKPKNDCSKPKNDCNKPKNDCNKPKIDCNKPKNDCNKPKIDCNKPKNDCNKPKNDCHRSKNPNYQRARNNFQRSRNPNCNKPKNNRYRSKNPNCNKSRNKSRNDSCTDKVETCCTKGK